jgi:uncharacterized membrane protein
VAILLAFQEGADIPEEGLGIQGFDLKDCHVVPLRYSYPMLDDTLHNIPVGASDATPDPSGDDLPPSARFEEIDIENGRNAALFSYIGAGFFFPIAFLPVWKRDNAYAFFHAKQAAILWIGLVLTLVLMSVTGLWPLLFLLPLFWLALWVAGSQVSQDDPDPRPLPLIHSLGEKLFADLQLRAESDED